MVLSTNLGYLGSYFLSVAKNSSWYSGYPLKKICTSIHCSLSDKAPKSPKRILKVDLPYLPKILESNNMFQNFRLNRILYRGSLNHGKF